MSKHHKKLGIFLGISISVIMAVILLFRISYITPILMYHSIVAEKPSDTLSVSVETFNRQMRFFKQWNYQVIPLERLALMIKDKQKIPHKTVAITFDDGRKDNYTYAFPVIKEYAVPVTIFTIINEMGDANHFSWEEMKEMHSSGLVTIGSHTLNHCYLKDEKSEEVMREQIFESKKMLEKELQVPVATFSYPVGGFNQKARKMVVEAGYLCAVGTYPGKKYPSDDIFVLKRVKITEKDKNLFIFWVKTSGYYTYFKDLFSRKKRDAGY